MTQKTARELLKDGYKTEVTKKEVQEAFDLTKVDASSLSARQKMSIGFRQILDDDQKQGLDD